MKAYQLLHLIYSFFLGLVVVGFVGIGINTFLPQPEYGSDAQWQTVFGNWQLTTSIALLICATLVMLASLVRPEKVPVISNGLLLGGLFTMVYAVGMSIGATHSWLRFGVITVALAVTVALGWFRFERADRAPLLPVTAEGAITDPAANARLVAVEAKLDAIAKALQD